MSHTQFVFFFHLFYLGQAPPILKHDLDQDRTRVTVDNDWVVLNLIVLGMK